MGNITLPLELQHTPAEAARRRAQELVELVGLQGFEDTLPRDLSGGMAQRVAIARALVHDPRPVVVGRAFRRPGCAYRERMGSELLRIWQARRKTVIMVTHAIPGGGFLADRVLVLSPRPGQVQNGSADLPAALARRSPLHCAFGELSRELRAAIG
jgi:NitT/TauT family transport system ATP-binding protein